MSGTVSEVVIEPVCCDGTGWVTSFSPCAVCNLHGFRCAFCGDLQGPNTPAALGDPRLSSVRLCEICSDRYRRRQEQTMNVDSMDLSD
jgi:hypothetical protein